MATRWWKATGLVLFGVAATAIAVAEGPPRTPSTSPSPAIAAAPVSDDIPLTAPDAAAVSVPSSPQAWGGPRTGMEPTLSDRVVDYRIQVSLDPDKHTLKGKQQLTWRNRSDRPVRSVYLHLYLNAFRNEGSTFFHEQRNFGFDFRSDVAMKDGEWGWIDMTRVMQAGASVPQIFVQPDNGPSTDMTVVRLDLPQAVAPGGSTTLDIDFDAQLPRVIARTGYFGSFHLIAQWFPKIGVLELPGERGATT
ncbi:MAG: M1 family metallopeptidase, partial [Pseudoxanthomonas sp.]